MTVAELIEKLKQYDQSLTVESVNYCMSYGVDWCEVEVVELSERGTVVLNQ